ncbi:MAG: hypothetical protein PHV99_03705 [Candidatus Pacebacteria bacterium]|nr:hypothetical protein [Candidatus Paceibacterota bacterium]
MFAPTAQAIPNPGGGGIPVHWIPKLKDITQPAVEGTDKTVVDVYFIPAMDNDAPLIRQWQWVDTICEWKECTIDENGNITRDSWASLTTGYSRRIVGSTNATWIEDITITARAIIHGYYWLMWRITIPAAYNEKYDFRVCVEYNKETTDADSPVIVQWDYPQPYYKQEPFYSDKARLDSIMANMTGEGNRTRAAYYAYALALEARINNTANRLVRTVYNDPLAYALALECLDWGGYALTESALVKTFAKEWPEGMHLTTLQNHSGLMWINYECEAYLEVAAYAQEYQSGFPRGYSAELVQWFLDRVYYLYNATYGTWQPAAAPPVEPALGLVELLLENLVIVAGLAGIAILLPALLWRNPILTLIALALLLIAGVDYVGWL